MTARAAALFLICLGLRAQEPAPVGIVLGDLLEVELGASGGELSIRSSGSRVFRFFFDARTYMEREKQRIQPARLLQGQSLEILSDAVGPNTALRYARTVRVIERAVAVRPRPFGGRFRSPRNAVDHIIPRGDLTFAGVISRLNPERMLLRTRLDGQKVILLRQDTRYLEGGTQAESADLKPNTRVYVRAGRNLDNEIEAYQVVWGEILNPSR
jgi:hypothetical protein